MDWLVYVWKVCSKGNYLLFLGISQPEGLSQSARTKFSLLYIYIYIYREDPLEKGMATHCSILAWRISWTEEPRGLQSVGLQRVGHG